MSAHMNPSQKSSEQQPFVKSFQTAVPLRLHTSDRDGLVSSAAPSGLGLFRRNHADLQATL